MGGAVAARVQDAIRRLLEGKHLYQSVDVETDDLIAAAAGARYSKPSPSVAGSPSRVSTQSMDTHVRSKLKAQIEEGLRKQWEFGDSPEGELGMRLVVELPSIEVVCRNKSCRDTKKAHNPVDSGAVWRKGSLRDERQVEVYHLVYQCQICRQEPLVFLVRRKGAKVTLIGRSVIERVDIADYVPRHVAEYYSQALISYQSRFPLAGIAYLRTVVEQHIKQVTGIQGRPTSDELGEAYSKLLNDNFPRSGTASLNTVYEELSEKLHGADADDEQFVKSLDDINKHFRLLQVFPLKRTT